MYCEGSINSTLVFNLGILEWTIKIVLENFEYTISLYRNIRINRMQINTEGFTKNEDIYNSLFIILLAKKNCGVPVILLKAI